MTIRTTIECDARNCFIDVDASDSVEKAIINAGWHTDPLDEYQHYCPTCWRAIKRDFISDKDMACEDS